MWKHTSKCDGGSNQGVQFLVTADGQLQMAGRDTLDFEILGCIPSELQHFGSQIFQHGGQVDASFGADARLLAGYGAQMALYATAGKLAKSR